MTRALALALTAAALLLALSGTAHAGYCHAFDGSAYAHPYAVGEDVVYFQNGTYDSYSGQVDWGDGTVTPIGNVEGSWSHSYSYPGDYPWHLTGSGSYTQNGRSVSCNDDERATITVWPLARLGLLGGFQQRPETTKLNIYLHPGAVQTPVDVAWKTQDATAKKGEDYVAASGVIHLTPGTVSTEFPIQIKEAEFSQPPEVFNVVLTGADGAFLDKKFKRSAIYLAGTPGPYYFRARPTGIECAVFRLGTKRAKVRCDHRKNRAAFLSRNKQARVKNVGRALNARDPEILSKGEKTVAGPFTCKALVDTVDCHTKKHGFDVGKNKESAF